jgi:2-polyprenyl-3-methyl-5-hydroxy-6-metoxy-1,4-benzoquinol methylase
VVDQISRGLLSPFLRNRRIASAVPFIEGRVLDIGCGVGILAGRYAPDQYFGFDTDVESIELARKGYPHHRFDTALPAGEIFDTIVGLAVIEHVPRPVEMLRQLRSHLAPDGKIVLTTPHPAFEWLHMLGSILGLFSDAAAEEHETLLDEKAMRQLGFDADLDIDISRRFLFGANQVFVLKKATRPLLEVR